MLRQGPKHKCYSKLIHVTAHFSLGVRLRRVRILVVRSLPIGQSASPQVRTLPQPIEKKDSVVLPWQDIRLSSCLL